MSQVKSIFLTAGQGVRHSALVQFFAAALAACGTPHPAVAYIGTASEDDADFFDEIRRLILKAGAREVTLVRLIDCPVDVAAVKNFIGSCEAIFINGGGVYEGMQGLWKYGLHTFLREQFHAGKVFFGLSAGSIMIGQHWVNWDEEKGGDAPEKFDCLGLAPLSFDCHAEEDDWDELKSLLSLMGPGAEGYALARGGCIRIDPTGQLVELAPNSCLKFKNVAGKISRV